MILNLTQHLATKDQLANGVVDLDQNRREKLQELLTISGIPSNRDLHDRAEKIIRLAWDFVYNTRPESEHHGILEVMIGGAQCLMPYLIDHCYRSDIIPFFSFTERVSEEVQKEDGTVQKISKFKHLGFVDAYSPIW